VAASASTKGSVSRRGSPLLQASTVYSPPPSPPTIPSSHRRPPPPLSREPKDERECRFVASRDAIHGSSLAFLKTGQIGGFQSKPGGVKNRRGLTEHVPDVGRYLNPGGPTPV
jgi:hypothetical protein